MQRGNSVPLDRAASRAGTGATIDIRATHSVAGCKAASLPIEQPVLIEINGYPVARLLATPEELTALAAGWVYAQGFVTSGEEIRTVSASGPRVSVMIDAPGPGGRSWASLLTSGFDTSHLGRDSEEVDGLSPLPGLGDRRAVRFDLIDVIQLVTRLFDAFRRDRTSGGYHFAGAVTSDGRERISRDVSRHNAVDKVIGWSLLDREGRRPVVLAMSGRITADIVYKAWRSQICLIVTRSLPTAEAVHLADRAGITLLGRALTEQRSIYTHAWRLGETLSM